MSAPEKKYADDKLFRVTWRDGNISDGYGRDKADAFTRMGYSGGALAAVDTFGEVEEAVPEAPAPSPR